MTRANPSGRRSMYALRHFYASWCINRREDGGLELPAKVIQERLGHSSTVIAMDVYAPVPAWRRHGRICRGRAALAGMSAI
jgi:integrase